MADAVHGYLPKTSYTLIRDLRLGRRERLAEFVARYEPPARAYIGGVLRRKSIAGVRIDELVNEFFEDKIVTLVLLTKFDPQKAQRGFRPYFKTALKNYLWSRLQETDPSISLDDSDSRVGQIIEENEPQPDAEYHNAWVRAMLDAALRLTQKRCEESGSTLHFELFAEFNVRDPDISWEDLARNYGERVAVIRGCHGAHGDLAADLIKEFVAEGAELPVLVMVSPDGKRRRMTLVRYAREDEAIILGFLGVDSIREAQCLAGCEVQLPLGSGKSARNLAQKAARCMRAALREILIEETGSERMAMKEMKELLSWFEG